ncbi:hypothetical protein CCR85_07645 [Rhodothalassium salexigens]|uniref:hypothetical protein n=1 Tax=Rhodothalassium salexigens TaxID=1086 RepID=UPI0019146884|nr:hypothetical protein [Rhodothalassium salexigens]MBK5911365.1 hypothetical protein [Rhodothalassium salexigens]MBK5921875.1 hypothetical protein [Rhodothalassium salexigens]
MSEIFRLPALPPAEARAPALPWRLNLGVRLLTLAPVAAYALTLQAIPLLLLGRTDAAAGLASGVVLALGLALPPDAYSLWSGDVSSPRWRVFIDRRRQRRLRPALEDHRVKRDAGQRAAVLFAVSVPVFLLVLLTVLGDDGSPRGYFKKYLVLMHILPLYSLVLLGVYAFRPPAGDSPSAGQDGGRPANPSRRVGLSRSARWALVAAGATLAAWTAGVAWDKTALTLAAPAALGVAALSAALFYAGLRSGLTPGAAHSLARQGHLEPPVDEPGSRNAAPDTPPDAPDTEPATGAPAPRRSV